MPRSVSMQGRGDDGILRPKSFSESMTEQHTFGMWHCLSFPCVQPSFFLPLSSTHSTDRFSVHNVLCKFDRMR